MDADLTEIDRVVSKPQPKNRSTGALVLFVLLAVLMPFSLIIYHFALWFAEQFAIASGSVAILAWAGLIGLAGQAFVISIVIAALWYFTKDERFKPIYM